MSEKIMKMKVLKETFAVCRLKNNEPIPKWSYEGDFFSITKTTDEISIVCPQENVPMGINCEKNWKALKLVGPLDFSLVGILSSISTILAKKRISIFAISTYDTDYILVKEFDIDNAIDALSAENYEIDL